MLIGQIQQLAVALILPLQLLGGADILLHFQNFPLQGGIFRLQRFVRENIVVNLHGTAVDRSHTAANGLQQGAQQVLRKSGSAGNRHDDRGHHSQRHANNEHGLDF